MPLATWNGLTIFFAHVPKTGGSSVEDYLVRRFGPLSIIDRNKRQGVTGTGLIIPATHLAAVDLAELLPHDLTYSFAVVRDPLTRLMSEFRYQSGVSRASRLGFSTWLRVMIAGARMEPRLYENHIRPQSDLVPEGSEIFRLEDGFDAMIARLDEVAGTTAPGLEVGHLLKRKREELVIHREDVDLITDYYGPDYARFGYAPPDRDAHPSDPYAALRRPFAHALARWVVARQHARWVR
jgi:hypothetical protein